MNTYSAAYSEAKRITSARYRIAQVGGVKSFVIKPLRDFVSPKIASSYQSSYQFGECLTN
jgi:hypothetical protein